jgi:hypothetical protein
MRLSLKKTGAGVLAAGALVLGLLQAATQVKRAREVDSVSDEQKLARTLGIIRTSTPEHPKVLKVLFYGQSITRSGWHTAVVDHWREQYPNTTFVVRNMAIGGFAAQVLVRTTERDIADFYPDLIVFHVYGDHREYEKIVRDFRSETAADVILQTDHGLRVPDPVCDEGLQLEPRRLPGCAGLGWVHQRNWSEEMSYHKLPALAKKYGLAVEPQLTWWREYLLQTGVDPKSLLIDEQHPNAQGKELMARFFNRYFDGLVAGWNGETGANVGSQPLASEKGGGPVAFSFSGSRLELIAHQPLSSWPQVTVDGVAAKDTDGCYLPSRSSGVATVPDWPAVRRISLHHDHVAEDWTATLTGFSPDQNSFHIEVRGSVSGDQGGADVTGARGDTDPNGKTFTTRNGLLSIEDQDWMMGASFVHSHQAQTGPVEVRWSVGYLCGGTPETVDQGSGRMEYRYTLAAGLSDAGHQAQVTLAAGDGAKADEIRSYRPPLGAN